MSETRNAIVSAPKMVEAANAPEGEGFIYTGCYFSTRPLAA